MSGDLNGDTNGNGNGNGVTESTVRSIVRSMLGGVVGATAGGIALTDDPVGFVQAVVAEWFVSGVLSLVGMFSLALETGFNAVTGSLMSVGQGLLSPFVIFGELVIEQLEVIDQTLAGLATAAGPLSFIVVIAAMGLVGIIAFGAVRAIIEVIRFI